MKTIRPNYLKKFQCNGKLCDSKCCKGWRVHVDELTYKKYLADEGILSHIEKVNGNYQVKMKENFECPFLDEDSLCKIQKKYGEGYLTAICYSYPRVNYKLGDILEQSLTLTCPIATRLILLSKEQIKFEEDEISEPRGIFDWTDRVENENLIELQMKAINLLQDKSYSLDERLLNLCRTMNEEELTIETRFDVEKYSSMMIEIFSEMYEAKMNEEKKVSLKKIFITYGEIILKRLLESYSYIFENYMVNEFYMRCYPIAFKGGLQYNTKIFVTSYKVMEFAMILMAISKNGFISEEEILMMINAVNEKMDHNRQGMKAIKNFANEIEDLNKFSNIMFKI